MTPHLTTIVKYFVVGAFLGLLVVVLYYTVSKMIFTEESLTKLFDGETLALRSDSPITVPVLFGFLGAIAGGIVESILWALRSTSMTPATAKPKSKKK
jgi:energy-coupling factor transporter transmembrane protein EcfT